MGYLSSFIEKQNLGEQSTYQAPGTREGKTARKEERGRERGETTSGGGREEGRKGGMERVREAEREEGW